MDELVAFLRAALDRDEHVAQLAAEDQAPPWKTYEATYGWAVATDSGGVIRDGDFDGPRATAEHIARWDPARVLVEVQAKRAILDRFIGQDGLFRDDIASGTAKIAIRLLAQPYAGQDGWREEWQLSAPA